MSNSEQKYIQCVCGRVIKDASEYKVLYLKKEQRELDILCPNDTCYLRELGFIKFDVIEDKPKITRASFYSPFVTWNIARLGKEQATKLLRQHLQDLIKKYVDWNKIIEETKKQEAREEEFRRRAAASEEVISENVSEGGE